MYRISEWSAQKQQHFSCCFVVKFAIFSVDHLALIKSEGSFMYFYLFISRILPNVMHFMYSFNYVNIAYAYVNDKECYLNIVIVY